MSHPLGTFKSFSFATFAERDSVDHVVKRFTDGVEVDVKKAVNLQQEKLEMIGEIVRSVCFSILDKMGRNNSN